MISERDNFVIVEHPDGRSASRHETRNAERDAKRSEAQGAGDATYEAFLENREAFEKWLRMNDDARIAPMNDEEMRAYSCAGWHVYSPRWDEEEALANSATRSWEAVVIFSKVQSAAWVKERFKGCGCTPLRINDRRMAEKNLVAHRRRRKATRGKKSFVPSSADLGNAGGEAQ